MKSEIGTAEDRIGWYLFFAKFAWERAEPGLRELGLGDLDFAALRPIAQRFVRDWQALNRATSGREREGTLNRRQQKLLDAALGGIEAELGESRLARFLTFAASIPPGVRKEGAFYDWALSWFNHWPEALYEEAPPPVFGRDAERAIGEAASRRRERAQQVTRLWRSIQSTAPSEEERKLFRLPDGASPGELPSTGGLVRALDLQPAREFWREVRSALTQEELDRLVVWCNEQDRVNEREAGVPPGRWRGLDDIR